VREPSIAILSDQNLFREGVVQLLHSQGFQRVSEYRSAAELLSSLGDSAPELVLVDMDHSTEDPYVFLRNLRERAPRSTVVIIGTAHQVGAANGVADGALETPEANAQVLRAVVSVMQMSEQPAVLPQPSAEAQLQRQQWSMLTPRQRDVLGFLATGSDNLKIAANLGISERAVKAHVSALLSLFSAENRTELAVLACRAGLRPPLRSLPRKPELTRAQAS
jgi:DNA-binding NarL/FixJ family response regulator